MLFQPRGSVAGSEASAVVHLSVRPTDGCGPHVLEGIRSLAKRLAEILGIGFVDADLGAPVSVASPYLVPNETLLGARAAAPLGIQSEAHLFGGVVPAGFVATKAITHRLVKPGAVAPAEWSARFAEAVASVVLDGFTAFTVAEARRAGAILLQRGRIRVKPANAEGGRGQTVVGDPRTLTATLERLEKGDVARFGVVLEENLADAITYSIGSVVVGDCAFSYWGKQRLTRTGAGKSVYGGTRLHAVRGGFDALLAQRNLPAGARRAVECACRYDAFARECFPGLIASRRNYDVVEGVDALGRLRTGVLEQSWRIGGASGAEIAALERFCADPELAEVEAVCVEAYGDNVAMPGHAWIYFQGHGEAGEALTKFAWAEKAA